jgi:hypothetical protein
VVPMRAEATPTEWEQLICRSLELLAPVRSRWVQERPKRAEIMRELVEEATDTLVEGERPGRGGRQP